MKNLLKNIITVFCISTILISLDVMAIEKPVNCDGYPQDAAMEISEPVGNWVSILCSSSGHALVPSFGQLWVHDKAGVFMFFAGGLDKNSFKASSKHDFYFKKIATRKLSGEHLNGINKMLATLQANSKTYDNVWQLDALSNRGILYTLFLYVDESPVWIIGCVDKCQKSLLLKAGPLASFKPK